ncbi:MAG: hypothetical protein ACRD5E_14355 [Nitrososphaeraceae archaeon]
MICRTDGCADHKEKESSFVLGITYDDIVKIFDLIYLTASKIFSCDFTCLGSRLGMVTMPGGGAEERNTGTIEFGIL